MKISLGSRIMSPLIKRLMISIVNDEVDFCLPEITRYAKEALGVSLKQATFIKEIGLGKKDFKPVSVAKLVFTDDLTFGIRVISYCDNQAFEKRVKHNEEFPQIFIPNPSVFGSLTSDINILRVFGSAKYRIFEREEGFVFMTTNEESYFGIKVKTICELVSSKTGSPMFRKPSHQSKIL